MSYGLTGSQSVLAVPLKNGTLGGLPWLNSPNRETQGHPGHRDFSITDKKECRLGHRDTSESSTTTSA